VTQNGGTLDNEACVDPNHTIDETSELDNCKHAIGAIVPTAPDLLINKSADKSSVTSGEDLTYTLTVSNVGTGNTDGSDVTVSDEVPSQVTVTDINPDGGWDCSASSGNTVSCKRSSLDAGASSHIVVKTNAGSTLTAPFTNSADVGGGGDLQMNNNHASVTTTVGGAAIDLKVVSITDTPDPVNPSTKLSYTAIVRNDGTSGAPGAVVRVILPIAGVSSQVVQADNGFNCAANMTVDPLGNTFDCVGDYGPTGSPTDATTITAEMTVKPTAPPPDEVKLTVVADPAGAFTEADETNNTKTETTTITGALCTGTPCVDLIATASGSPIVPLLGPAVYTASIVNVGDTPVPDSPAWSVDFTFTGVGVLSVAPPSGVTCTALTPLLTRCTSVDGSADAMDLAPGAGLAFVATVAGVAPPGLVFFEAHADATGKVMELSEGNNIAIAPTVVTP
jgi:uncharacterized repeat protein (TIGR01451 family)